MEQNGKSEFFILLHFVPFCVLLMITGDHSANIPNVITCWCQKRSSKPQSKCLIRITSLSLQQVLLYTLYRQLLTAGRGLCILVITNYWIPCHSYSAQSDRWHNHTYHNYSLLVRLPDYAWLIVYNAVSKQPSCNSFSPELQLFVLCSKLSK